MNTDSTLRGIENKVRTRDCLGMTGLANEPSSPFCCSRHNLNKGNILRLVLPINDDGLSTSVTFKIVHAF